MTYAQVRPGNHSSKMPNGRGKNPGLFRIKSNKLLRSKLRSIPQADEFVSRLHFRNKSRKISARNKRIFTVSQAAAILGVSTKTLRRWDKKAILSSKRTSGNQRRYTRKELLILFREIERKKVRNVRKVRLVRGEMRRKVSTPTSLPPTSLTPLTLIQNDFVRSCQLLTKGSWKIYSLALFALVISFVLTSLILFAIFKFSKLTLSPISPLLALFFWPISLVQSFILLALDILLAFWALYLIYKKYFAHRAKIHANKIIAPSEKITKPLVALHMRTLQKQSINHYFFDLVLLVCLVVMILFANSVIQLQRASSLQVGHTTYQYFEVH